MLENLRVMRSFVDAHDDAVLVFPVHPNPNVVAVSQELLSNHSRIHLVEPLAYPQFITLLSHASLIVSDHGLGNETGEPTTMKPAGTEAE